MHAAKLRRLGALLARYETADTSLAEERELRQLLADPELPERFAPERRIHAGFAALAAPSLNAPMPWEIEAAHREPSPAPHVERRRAPARPRYRSRLRPLLALAAGVVLLIAAGLVYYLQPDEAPLVAEVEPTAIDWSRYEVTDPVEAARITRGALLEVSDRLEHGGRLTHDKLEHFEPLHHAF